MKGLGGGGGEAGAEKEKEKRETFAQCSKVNQFSKFSTGRREGYYYPGSKQNYLRERKKKLLDFTTFRM